MLSLRRTILGTVVTSIYRDVIGLIFGGEIKGLSVGRLSRNIHSDQSHEKHVSRFFAKNGVGFGMLKGI